MNTELPVSSSSSRGEGSHENHEACGSVSASALLGPEHVFRALDEMARLGVRVWVHGGWAIDAVTGTSRPHADIDFLANEEDLPRLRQAFSSQIVEEAMHKIVVALDGAEVEVTFFRRLSPNLYVTVTPRIIALWDPRDLGEDTATLAGRAIPVVGVRALYVLVANPVRKKAPMLEKNRRDLERLKPFVSPEDRATAPQWFPVPNTRWNRIRLSCAVAWDRFLSFLRGEGAAKK